MIMRARDNNEGKMSGEDVDKVQWRGGRTMMRVQDKDVKDSIFTPTHSELETSGRASWSWTREGLQSRPFPCPNHAGRKKTEFFFFFQSQPPTLNGHPGFGHKKGVISKCSDVSIAPSQDRSLKILPLKL